MTGTTGVSVRHLQRTAWTEIVLDVDHDERGISEESWLSPLGDGPRCRMRAKPASRPTDREDQW